MKRIPTYNEYEITDPDAPVDPFQFINQEDQQQVETQPQDQGQQVETQPQGQQPQIDLEEHYRLKFEAEQRVKAEQQAQQQPSEIDEITKQIAELDIRYAALLQQGGTVEELSKISVEKSVIQVRLTEVASRQYASQLVEANAQRAALPSTFDKEVKQILKEGFNLEFTGNAWDILPQELRANPQVLDTMNQHPEWRRMIADSAALNAMKQSRGGGQQKRAPMPAGQVTAGSQQAQQKQSNQPVVVTIDSIMGRKKA